MRPAASIRILFAALALTGLASGPLAAQILNTRALSSGEIDGDPYKFTGIVLAYPRGSTGGYDWRGSGSVARHPKIVISCSHVIHTGSAWYTGDFRWFRKWPSSSRPAASQGQLMRGAVRWASYHTEKRNDLAAGVPEGLSSPNAFDHDVTAFWSYENTANGGYAGWYTDGRPSMKSTWPKMITGYPARPFGTWTYLMHQTGIFNSQFSEVTKRGGGRTTRYMRPPVDTVPLGGNSGGPLWARDNEGNWGQAGVFVSGGTGVVSLDAPAWNQIAAAITSSGSPSGPGTPPPPSPSDDHGNTSGLATNLTLGSTRSGTLETGGDYDFFRFTAAAAGDFLIESSGSTDVFGSLYSSSLSLIAEDDDSGENSNFRLLRRLAVGTYFVRVRGYSSSTTGAYGLRVTQTSVTAPEITIQGLGSRVVQNGDTTPDAADGTQMGSVLAGNSQTRTFTILNTGNAPLALTGSPRVQISGTGSSQFSLQQPALSSLSSGQSTTFSVIFQPTAGGAHSATISIPNDDSDENPSQFRVLGTGNMPAYDDHGDTLATATNITNLPNTQGTINFGGDPDFFLFTASERAVYTFETKGSTDTFGTLYTNGGTVITEDDDGSGTLNFRISRDLQPGNYFLRVRGYSISTLGAYTLEVRSNRPEPEIGVTTPDLTPIPDGDLSPSSEQSTDFGAVLHAAGSIERTFVIENKGVSNLQLDGNPRVAITGAGAAHFRVSSQPSTNSLRPGASTAFRLRFTPTLPGIHTATIVISNNDSNENPYDFVVRGEGTGILDDHGNTTGTSTTVPFPGYVPGMLGRGGDVDVFRFVVPRSRFVEILTTGLTDTYGQLLNASGNVLASDDDSGDGANFRFYRLLHPGTYFVRCRGYAETTTGGYDFHLLAGPLAGSDLQVRGAGGRFIPPGILYAQSSDGTDFGTVPVIGASIERTFTLKNNGTGAVNLTGSPSLQLTGPGASSFSFQRLPQNTLPPGASAIFSLRFDPRANDTATATVEILSDDPANPVYRFVVAGRGTGGSGAPDDHGDLQSTSTRVAANSLTNGAIGQSGDADFFSFLVPVESFIRVSTLGSMDTIGHLFDASGRNIAFSDDDGDGFNFMIARTVPAGLYAVRVRPYSSELTGNYQFSFQSEPAYPNITISGNNTTIPSGSLSPSLSDATDFGTIDYRSGSRTASFRVMNFGNGTLALSGNPRVQIGGADAPHFRVTSLPAATVSSGGATAFSVRYDPSGSGLHTAEILIPSNDPDTSPYRFTIRGFGSGPITTDDHGNTNLTASTLPLGSTVGGHLERDGDFDCFRIQVPGLSTLEVSSSGNTDTFARLYDSTGRLIAEDDDSGAGLNFELGLQVAPGDYYLQVSGFSNSTTGLYDVRATTTGMAIDDHGNTFGNATSITIGSSSSGEITAADVDIFVFSLSGTGGILAETNGPTDTFGTLFSSTGQILASDDDSGESLNFQLMRLNLPAGTYYLQVKGFSPNTTGAYTLRVSSP